MFNSKLKNENKRLNSIMKGKDEEIHYLTSKLYRPVNVNEDTDLNSKYMTLMFKYNKLMDSVLAKDTEIIVYNGELYGITEITFNKRVDSLDTIEIEAIHTHREKGLIDNLNDTFKSVAKELNKVFFGNENN